MYYIGIDIGGTKCAVTLGKYDGKSMEIAEKSKFDTSGSPESMLARFLSETDALLAKRGLSYSDIVSCGISCGGPLDPKAGVVLSPPNLPGWDNVHVVEFFKEKTGIRTKLENDANACAVAEWKLGAGRGFDNVIFLTFGTGLGAGLILDGRLYSGTNGNAGEAGHIRLCEYGPSGYGKAGSFEGFCSGRGIAQIGQTLALEAMQNGKRVAYLDCIENISKVNARDIAIAADAGDEVAKEVYRESGRRLGQGLSVLVDILNPQRIIIGSIFTRSANLLFDECDRIMKKECLPIAYDVCKVVPAQLGESIGDFAALSLAMTVTE